MIEIRAPRSILELKEICNQIDETFGEQYHPSLELLLRLANACPEQIVGAYEDGKLIAHSFVLPLSDAGREFFFHPDLPESALSEEHLILNPTKEERVHLFVYSIVAKKKKLAFSMIKSLMQAVATMQPLSHPESTFVAEVVSQDGKNLAGKLGLEFFHSYFFEGDEEVFIYQNNARTSLEAFSRYDKSIMPIHMNEA